MNRERERDLELPDEDDYGGLEKLGLQLVLSAAKISGIAVSNFLKFLSVSIEAGMSCFHYLGSPIRHRWPAFHLSESWVHPGRGKYSDFRKKRQLNDVVGEEYNASLFSIFYIFF